MAIIFRGTTTAQEVVAGTLLEIVERSALVRSPAVIVVGDVVSFSDKLAWFFPPDTRRQLEQSEHSTEAGTQF